jgi:hypothetical protein
MRPFRPRRPSPALVVACLALLVALSGTSYAAVVLPRGSVGTPQLKAGAVTSVKVKDGALKLLDFAAVERAQLKGDSGQAGPQGPEGDKGDKGDKGTKGETGAQGAPGLSGYTIIEKTASSTTGFLAIQVNCPAGMLAIAGGGGTQTPGAGVTVRNSFPIRNPASWLMVLDAKSPGSGWNYRANAVCAKVAP